MALGAGACTPTTIPPAPPIPTATNAPIPGPDPALAELVPNRVARDGVLLIGTDPSYPPMEFLDGSGATVGADIDLATGVASVLGLTPRIVDEAFSALPGSVRAGRIELAASSLTVPADKPVLDPAVLYFDSGSQLVTRVRGASLSPRDLCGREIATLEGSFQVRVLRHRSADCRDAGAPPIQIAGYSEQEQVTRVTVAGGSDALLTDRPVAQFTVASHPDRLRLAGRPLDPQPFGMLVPDGFGRAARAAMQQLIDVGYYASVLRHWGIQSGAVTHATLRRPAPATRQSRPGGRGGQ